MYMELGRHMTQTVSQATRRSAVKATQVQLILVQDGWKEPRAGG